MDFRQLVRALMAWFRYHDAETAEDQDVITERNAQQSLLLRLPGELRNSIYGFTFAGVTIHLYEIVGSDRQHVACARDSSLDAPVATNILNLIEVSRQLRFETRLYSFKLSTFHVVHDTSFARFVDGLAEDQRNAIAILQVDREQAYTAGALYDLSFSPPKSIAAAWHTPAEIASHQQIFRARLRDWSCKMAFDRLQGLKKVVVEDERQFDRWGRRIPAPTNKYGEGIKHCVGNPKLEILYAD
jgi:hypothetical protein